MSSISEMDVVAVAPQPTTEPTPATSIKPSKMEVEDEDQEPEIKVHKTRRIVNPDDDDDEAPASKPEPATSYDTKKTSAPSAKAAPTKDKPKDNDDESLSVTKQKLKDEKKPSQQKVSTSYYSDEENGANKPAKKTTTAPKSKEDTKKSNDTKDTPKSKPQNGSDLTKVKREKTDPDDVPLAKRSKENDTKKTTESKDAQKPKADDDDKPLKEVKKELKETPQKDADKKKAEVKKTPLIKKEAATPKKDDKKATPNKATGKKRKSDSEPTPKKKKKAESDSESSDSDSDSDSSDSDSDSDAPKKGKKKVTKKTPTKSKTTASKSKSKSTPKKGDKDKEKDKDKKKKKKDDLLSDDEYEWWKEEPLPEGQYWRTLHHNGILFPPPYKPHGVKMLYDGKPVDLTPEQEEVATYYAQYLEADHVKKPVFNKNFFEEFLGVLNKGSKKKKDHAIKEFSKCDFTPIHKYLMEQKELRKNRSADEKKKEKEEKRQLQEKYGIAIVDGHKQRISNYRVEPPGLFLGRGAHPKTGKLKARIQPEDITLNLSEDVPVPPAPDGHKWKEIVHDNTVSWLAFWKENINDNFKYMWLAPSSRIKGMADMKKFEVARNLKKLIGKIRERYTKELKDDDMAAKQRATALWVIDHLALRVGNEKGEDQADTVGCCSLRVEHIKLKDPNIVKFDFLGKDSMRYKNSVTVDDQVFKNFKAFVKGKKGSEDIFDKLTTTSLNAHLKEQMDGLTAKVFRTYNASITLEKELAKMPTDIATVEEKVLYYNRANREVAILCNHQKTVSKKHGEQMEKLDTQLQELKDEQEKMEERLKKAKKGIKIEDSDDDDEPKKKKRGAKDADSDSDSDDKKKKKGKGKDDDGTPKKKKKLPTEPDKIQKHIVRLKERIHKLEIKKTEKDECKTVALGTAKINYMDPRITAAWCNKHNVPIEKIFSQSLRKKFPWAMDADPDWKF